MILLKGAIPVPAATNINGVDNSFGTGNEPDLINQRTLGSSEGLSPDK